METNSRPARIRRRIFAVGIPTLALVIGVGIGTSATGETPEPRVETIVQTETVEVPVEKEIEVEVPVTPAACIAALDEAEALNQLNIEAFGVVADMFDAASSFDVAGINSGSAKLDALQPDVALKVADYNVEAEACRAN